MPPKRIPKSCVKARINALLLKCHLIISIASDPFHIDDAFEEVSRALYLVEYFHFTNGPFHARALLFRGHCFRALACWSEASVDYQRTARIGGMDMQRLAEKCLINMRLEKEEAARRQLMKLGGRDSGYGCEGQMDQETESEGGEEKMVDEEAEEREDSYLLQMARNVKGEQEAERKLRERLVAEAEREKELRKMEKAKRIEAERVKRVQEEKMRERARVRVRQKLQEAEA